MIFGNRYIKYFNELSINGEEQDTELEDPEENQDNQNDNIVNADGDELPDPEEDPAPENTVDAEGDELQDPEEGDQPNNTATDEGDTVDAAPDNDLDLPDDTEGKDNTGNTNAGEDGSSLDMSDGTELDTGDDGETDDTATEEEPVDGGNATGEENETGDENPNLYADLTPEQMKIKSLELKSNFNSLFMTCDNVVNKVGDIPKNSDNAEVMKRIMKICTELKDSIEHYILNNFNISSHIDNRIMFKKYLTILKGIKKIMADIEKEMVNKLEDDAKEITSESIHIIESLSLLHVV